MGFDLPSNSSVVDQGQMITVPWSSWFQRAHNIVISAQQSGVTGDRPTSLLWIGRRFFDTTIGKPVYLKSINPSVWVDGAGTVS